MRNPFREHEKEKSLRQECVNSKIEQGALLVKKAESNAIADVMHPALLSSFAGKAAAPDL
jgi:hypothetical protein